MSVWTYPTSAANNVWPIDLTYADGYVLLGGYFTGSIDFGGGTVLTSGANGTIDNGFVVKSNATDGTISWARAISSPLGGVATVYRPILDGNGNAAISGNRCRGIWTSECSAYVQLLDGDTGDVLWDKDLGPQTERATGLAWSDDGKFYLGTGFTGPLVVDGLVLTPLADMDGLVLVLDATDGTAEWAIMFSGADDVLPLWREIVEIQVVDDGIYTLCRRCANIRTTESETTLAWDQTFTTGIAKISRTSGEPLWTADVPASVDMVARPDGIYVSFTQFGSATYGDTTFQDWGLGDTFVAKLDPGTGSGQWILQTGGQGNDAFVTTLAADPVSGDIFLTGQLHSNPAYYDPLVVDSHSTDDGVDLVIARLRTSDEQLPSCKIDAGTIDPTFCFITNVCYEAGAPSRAASTEACMTCSPAESQTSFTLTRADYALVDGSCVYAPFGVLAGFAPVTDVTPHSMIDLDVQDIEATSDAADFEAALLVYENGGNFVSSSGKVKNLMEFSTSGPSKMTDHTWYPIYRDYWNDDNYANTFVQNAFAVTGSWASRSDVMRGELGTKGAVYQGLWMYMLHEMEEAIVQCDAGNTYLAGNSTSAPHRWDEFWAFYAGSLEDVDGSGSGKLFWALAEKRCPQFGTCNAIGGAIVNDKALASATAGLEKILQANCSSAKDDFSSIVTLTTIPLLQGLLRYVYLADPTVNGGSCTVDICTYDKQWAEAWAFAAAILPQIHQCNSTVAQILDDNINVAIPGDDVIKDGYQLVKAQIESTYSCLGITCADVGELLDETTGTAFLGMEMCLDD